MAHGAKAPPPEDVGIDWRGLRHRLAAREVVEEVGFGKAQLLVLVTGGSVIFNRGMQMCLLSILTLPIAMDLRLTASQQGMLSTALLSGMFTGTMVSGWCGDVAGRRFPIVFSSISTVLIGCASAACVSFRWLFCARVCLGFAMALGDVPMLVLLSEVTPVKWRIPVRAATEGIFNIGYIYAAVLAACCDAYLRDLSWQKLTLLTCAVPGAMGLCAAAFMPESPLLLAGRGDSVGATRVFDQLRRLNRRPRACIDVQPSRIPAKARDRGRLADSLNTVLGKHYLRTTCVLAFAAFALNVFHFVGAHAQPRTTAVRGGVPLAGQEIVAGSSFNLIGASVATALAQSVPRRRALGLCMALAALSIACVGHAGSALDRTPALEVMYQAGLFGLYWVPAVGFVSFGQLVVDSYPTLASATGLSAALCAGRLGSAVAPLVLEHFLWDFGGLWQLFCYLSSALCAMGAVSLCRMPQAGETAKRVKHDVSPASRWLSLAGT